MCLLFLLTGLAAERGNRPTLPPPINLPLRAQSIGFRTADDIAVKLGLPRDSVPRLATGLNYVLAQAANEDGHCFLPENELMRRA